MTGPLFGRVEDLAAIRRSTDPARGGGALLLDGQPAVGKSAVLTVIAETASAAGVLTLRASGSESAAAGSFSGLDRLLTPLRHDFHRLSADHRRALTAALGPGNGPPAAFLLLSTATLALFRLTGAARPLLVLIDDADRLDDASAAVLAVAARRLTGTGVGLVAAVRTGSDCPFARAGLPQRHLLPLDDNSASRLLRSRFPALSQRVNERVLAEAQGHPLALEDLPAALTPAQRAGQQALPAVLPLGPRLRTLFAAAVRNLPARTRELLLLTALDATGDLAVLAAASGDGRLDGLAPAERAGLASTQAVAGRLVFSHPLVRSTVVELSTPVQRRQAHRALAAELGDRSERRAWHLAQATIGTDERVASLLEQTALTNLGRGDAVDAVAALTTAAELSPAPVDSTRRRARAAYVAANVTGELWRASRLRTAAPTSELSLPAAMAAASLALNDDGDVLAAHRLLADALERVPDHEGPLDETVVEALHTLLLVCFFAGRAELWTPFDRAVGRLGNRVPELLVLCGATMRDPARTAARAIDELTVAIGGLAHVVDPTQIVRTGMAAIYVDRLAGCRDALRRVVEDGRGGGAVASAIDAVLLLAFERLAAGSWTEAQQLADEGVRLTASHGYGVLRWPGRFAQALLAAARGTTDAVTALCDEMDGWAEPRGVGIVRVYAAHARGLAALGRGDFEGAYRHATQISPPGVLDVAHALWVTMDLVDAAVHSGRRTEAQAHVAAMEAAGIGALSARLALLSAGSAAMAADDDAAGPLYGVALALPQAGEWPFELARVQLAYGEHLRRGGAAALARRQLASARELFEQLGAQPWVARASGRPWADDPATASGRARDGAALTTKELEIARLAAAGLTNKEIGDRLYLSPRTIGANLYRIFPKLDVTSRTALGSALARHLPPSDGADQSP